MFLTKFIEKRKFIKETLIRLEKYYNMDKDRMMMVANRNWKIKNREKFPDYVEKIRRKCFVCDKVHIVCGGFFLSKMKVIYHKKKQYIVSVYAPLGCWLEHNQKFIKEFFEEETHYGWKKAQKSTTKPKASGHNNLNQDER